MAGLHLGSDTHKTLRWEAGASYMPTILAECLTPLPVWLIGPPVCWLQTCAVGSYRTVHVGLGPNNVMVVVDDHGTAEHVQVLHHVLLDVCQRGDLSVVAFMEKQSCESLFWHISHIYKCLHKVRKWGAKACICTDSLVYFTKSALICFVSTLFCGYNFLWKPRVSKHYLCSSQDTGPMLKTRVSI